MNKLFIILILLILASGCVQGPVACTEDARLCPDGTSVVRVPPDCEFEPCPKCSEGDTRNGTCPDGTQYLRLSCDGNGEWHEVVYVRNPCETVEEPPEGFNDTEECDAPVFTHYFVDPGKVKLVQPIGVVHGSGKILVGRSYVVTKEEYDNEKVPVYAPADAVTYFGSYYTGGSEPGEGNLPDYAITFDLGCGYRLSFAHLKEMAPEIAEIMPELSSSSAGIRIERIELKAGELIGYYIPNTGVAAFDIIVESDGITNQFPNQERYEKYGSNLLKVMCPYDLYTGEMKDAYYDLFGGASGTLLHNRDCGTVERDVPGAVEGMWFLDKIPVRGVHDTDKQGLYGSPMPVVDDGERITIGIIDEPNIWVYHDNPTYADPAEITDSHCYQAMPPSHEEGYIYFEVVSDMEMKVFRSETGACPESFPEEGWKSYYR